MAKMLVLPFRRGPFWNFSYIVACTATGEAAVIDPAWDVPGILEAAKDRDLSIRSAILTHSHSDHANGVSALVEAAGSRVYAHEDEAGGLAAHHEGTFEGLAGGETLRVGDLELEVLHTPGHSPGSLSIVVGGALFSGDTLNVGSAGRPGPGQAAVEALWESVGRLARLPVETVIHPGHDEGAKPASTVGDEFRSGALGAASFEAFVEALERTTGRNHRHG